MPDFKAVVTVLIKGSILDPQGRAVENTLKRLGHANVANLRVGKHIELTLSGERGEVEAQLHAIVTDILSNPVMEDVRYTLHQVEVSTH